MQCACDRRTLANRQIGAAEAISAEAAVALYCTTPVALGQVADLCVLTQPWVKVTQQLADATVSHTLRDGKLIFLRD